MRNAIGVLRLLRDAAKEGTDAGNGGMGLLKAFGEYVDRWAVIGYRVHLRSTSQQPASQAPSRQWLLLPEVQRLIRGSKRLVGNKHGLTIAGPSLGRVRFTLTISNLITTSCFVDSSVLGSIK